MRKIFTYSRNEDDLLKKGEVAFLEKGESNNRKRKKNASGQM